MDKVQLHKAKTKAEPINFSGSNQKNVQDKLNGLSPPNRSLCRTDRHVAYTCLNLTARITRATKPLHLLHHRRTTNCFTGITSETASIFHGCALFNGEHPSIISRSHPESPTTWLRTPRTSISFFSSLCLHRQKASSIYLRSHPTEQNRQTEEPQAKLKSHPIQIGTKPQTHKLIKSQQREALTTSSLQSHNPETTELKMPPPPGIRRSNWWKEINSLFSQNTCRRK